MIEGVTIVEMFGLFLGSSGIVGLIVGFSTIKYMRWKAKSEAKSAEAEAKGADADADIKRQDYYQEMLDDMQKDRERMKVVRDEQEAYIVQLKEDRKLLREERDELRRENEELRNIINDLRETIRKHGDKIARLGRMYKAMTPLICTNTGCNKRQGDIMGLVADDSFDVVDKTNVNEETTEEANTAEEVKEEGKKRPSKKGTKA